MWYSDSHVDQPSPQLVEIAQVERTGDRYDLGTGHLTCLPRFLPASHSGGSVFSKRQEVQLSCRKPLTDWYLSHGMPYAGHCSCPSHPQASLGSFPGECWASYPSYDGPPGMMSSV